MRVTTDVAISLLEIAHQIGIGNARHVLSAGLAGTPIRQGSAKLYDDRAIELLLDRPECPEAVLDRCRPFIARVGLGKTLHVNDPWEQRIAAVAGPWRLRMPTALQLTARPRHPLVGVLAGWVVVGGEITGVRNNRFEVSPPGDWFADLEHTWLPVTGRSPWQLWGAATEYGTLEDPLVADPPTRDRRRQTRRSQAQRIERAAREIGCFDDVPVRSNGRL